MNILIIEDEEMIRESLKIRLSRKGHIVFTYSTGLGAQRFAENIKPDLVISDHDLGAGDKGLQIATNLKKKGFEVILMSGNEGIRSAAWDNVIPFIMKPNVKELLEMVDDIAKEIAA